MADATQTTAVPTTTVATPTSTAKSIYRTSPLIYVIRIIQFLFAITIVGIAGSAISDWHSLGCSTPPRLTLNFAVGIISLVLILYFLLSTGSYAKLPWHILASFILDSLFAILWIIVAAMANYTCDSVCSACSVPGAEVDIGYGFFVYVNSLFCECVFPGDFDFVKRLDGPMGIFKRKGIPKSGSGSGLGKDVGKTLEKSYSTSTKRGLDSTMIILFLSSLLALVTLRYLNTPAATAPEVEMHESEQKEPQNVDTVYKVEQPGATVNVQQLA